MPEQSPLRLVRRSLKYLPLADIEKLPRKMRGIYVLYKHRTRIDKYDVVYVGMTVAGEAGGIRGRLKKHRKHKVDLWTHCSVFEVWDNIRDEEVVELEGLFRFIYKDDSSANSLNIQKGFRKMNATIIPNVEDWHAS